MTTKIAGEIEDKNSFKNKFLGVISAQGIFINEMAVLGTVLCVIFNPGPTIEMIAKNAVFIPRGKELRRFSGMIDKNGKQGKIEGLIAANGIFITIYGDDGNPEYTLWNPGDTEEIDPCWSCTPKK